MSKYKPTKLDSAIGWAALFLAASVVVMFFGLLASVADAAPICRVQKVVAHNYVAPLAVAPNVYYQVGQSLQREAVATQQLRQSDEYIELLELRAYKSGVEAVASISGAGSHGPAGLAIPTGDNPAGTEQPPANSFAARYPTLAAKCSKCHSGDTPKGDVFIDGSVPFDGPDAAPKRDAIAAAIVNGRMPKGGSLEDQEQFNALVELFTEPVSGESK